MQKITIKDKATIVKLRGLGFNQKEIANELEVSPATISYQLKQIKKLALKEGIDNVFQHYVLWMKMKWMK